MSDELATRVNRWTPVAETTEFTKTERSAGARLAVVEDNVRGIETTILEDHITAITANRWRKIVLIGVAILDRIGNPLDNSCDQILDKRGQSLRGVAGN